MVGTLPPTKWLLTKNDMVLGIFDSKVSIAIYLGFSGTDEGWIVDSKGNRYGPSYLMKEQEGPSYAGHWEDRTAILKDWANYHLKLPIDYSIYRILV